MSSWSRSHFLTTAAATGAALGAGAANLAIPRVAGAQAAAAATTIAGYVGEKMLAGALGKAGGAALGKIVASLGLGGPTLADVAAQLSMISQQLEALQRSVQQLEQNMNHQLADLSYQVAFGEKTQALIDKNRRLLDRYAALLAPGGLDEPGRTNRLDEIHYVLVDVDYSDGVRGWYNKLAGNPQAGAKGLIELFGRATQVHNNGFLNPATAKAVQDHFDYFDGQMAITAMFNLELFQANGQRIEALQLISNWAQARSALLSIVRGGSRVADQSWVRNGADVQLQTTALHGLPPKTVFVPATGRLYYATVLGPVQLSYARDKKRSYDGEPRSVLTFYPLEWLRDQMNQNLARAMQETGLGPRSQWSALTAHELGDLVTALPGGKTGGDDRIIGPMQNVGFEIPSGQRQFLTNDIWYDHCLNCDGGHSSNLAHSVIVKEGGGWDFNGSGPNGGLLPILSYAPPPNAPFTFIWT